MKRLAFGLGLSLIFIFSFFTEATASTSSASLAFLSSGLPGCFSLVSGRAITEAAAQLLPPHCQAFRKSYLNSLNQFSKNQKQFEKEIQIAIQNTLSKKAPPYHALLLSVMAGKLSAVTLKQVQARAKAENLAKLHYRYAAAAIERIEQGHCTHYHEPAYEEICSGKDPLFERIALLNQAASSSGAKP